MRFLGNLRIRTKFLFIPLVAAACLGLLGALSIRILEAQRARLLDVAQNDLVKIEVLSSLFSQLSTNHVSIFDLLATAKTDLDEERLYEMGKIHLNRIHDIISQFDRTAEQFALTGYERRIHENLKIELAKYGHVAGTALEMATVNLALATQHMVKANKSYSEVNRLFLALLDEARRNSNSAITDVANEFGRRVAQFPALLVGAIVGLSAITLTMSHLLSREIIAISRITTELAMGDKSVAIPYVGRKDEIGSMAQATETFKNNLIRLAESEAASLGLNQKLEEEVRERRQAQEALRRANEDLERRVEERTAELKVSNDRLQGEVEERTRAEAALAEQSAALQATMDNIGQGISVFDRDLRLVAWNHRFPDLMDLPPGLAQEGTPFVEFLRHAAALGEYGPGDPEERVAERLALARKFEPYSFERARPNGRVIEFRRNPMPGGGFVTTYTDITERKQADATRQALHQASLQIQEALTVEERLSRLMQTAQEVLKLDRVNVLLADPKGEWLQAVAGLGTGQPLEEIRVPIGPEGGGLARTFLTGQAVVWNGQGPVPEELRLKPPYDRIEAFRSRVFANIPLVVHGRTIGVIGADRKRSQRPFEPGLLDLLQLFGGQAALAIEQARLYEALAQQSALLQATLDNITQGISAFDKDLRLIAWNQRYFELRDLPPALARRGTPFADLIRYNAARGEYGPGDPEEQVAQRLALARSSEPQSFERTRPNGTVIEVRRNPMPVGGFVTTLTDITERKQADQMKSDFVSFVTHQLRTPLSGIKWMLELAAQEKSLPPEARSYVTDAQAAGERLIRLVNDLLDISRLERGKLTIVPQETRLEELTQCVVDELALLIAEKGHHVSVTAAENLPPVWVDPQLLQQVILNLTSNAIKYTPPGGEIAIRMGREDAAVCWAVQDSGIGIPKAAHDRLFEKFYRADNVYTIETEGTGLGLYLVRLILDQLEGRVRCESEEGRGATFTFTLPLRKGG